MIRTLLGLCARDTATAGMLAALGRRLAAWQADAIAWGRLVGTAEKHGMAPLVHKHLTALGLLPPDTPRRQRETPLAPRVTEADIAAHAAFVATLGATPYWNEYSKEE